MLLASHDVVLLYAQRTLAQEMEVSRQITLKYNGGPSVVLPSQLVTQHDGNYFVKFRASHYAIAKLVLGYKDEYKPCHSVNLSSSPQWKEFQTLLKEALKKHFNIGATDDCFEEANEPEETGTRGWKKLLDKMALTMTVDIGGTNVEVLTPSSFKCSDVNVKLEAAQLKAFCDFMSQNVDDCFGGKKRKYTKRKTEDGGHHSDE